jgi:polysaccharide export outer membrane protein
MLIFMFLAALQAPPANSIDPTLYIVGPNDVLSINVFNQPQLSGSFTVEADGTLAFPLLGRLPVGGLNIRVVENEVSRRLAAGYVKDPHVTVSVGQYRSQQIFVMGEVRQPGSLALTGSMTLLEALARVGSTTERAGPEAIIVRAPAAGVSAKPATLKPGVISNADTIRVSLANLQTGTLSENVTLRAGDTIFIPRAETVFVSGHVRSAGEFVMRSRMTVRQALALAGGVTDRGSTRRVQIIRQVDGKEVTVNADLQTPVQSGDTIVVRERFW